MIWYLIFGYLINGGLTTFRYFLTDGVAAWNFALRLIYVRVPHTNESSRNKNKSWLIYL